MGSSGGGTRAPNTPAPPGNMIAPPGQAVNYQPQWLNFLPQDPAAMATGLTPEMLAQMSAPPPPPPPPPMAAAPAAGPTGPSIRFGQGPAMSRADLARQMTRKPRRGNK